MAVITLRDVTLAYHGQAVARGLTGAFEPGQATAVIGPNGSGKSTLLRAIASGAPPWAGQIRYGGFRSRDVAYLPQEPGLERTFPITAEDLVSLGFMRRLGLFGGLGAQERDRLAEIVAEAGLSGLARRPIEALSGGQFQRARFARIVAQDAPAVLLDEPFSALDAQTIEALTALTACWSDQGRVVVMVLHDFELVRRLCPRTLVLARDVVAWGPTSSVLTPENLDCARAKALTWRDGNAS